MARVSLLDLGQAFVNGEIDVADIKDLGEVVFERAQTAASALTSSVSKASLSQPGSFNGGGTSSRSQRSRSVSPLKSAHTSMMASLAAGDFGAALEHGAERAFSPIRNKKLPEGRKDRKRYNRTKAVGMSESMDSQAEEALVTNFEQPWCLQSCLHHNPSCQRICFPAEYATRHRRTAEGNGDNDDGEIDGEDAQINFGLPDFAQAGYSLSDENEAAWPDMNVPNRLGLTQAIHRKTSIQRLCLIRFKEDLPVGTSRKELRNLVKILQKCDHCNVLTLQEALEDNDHLYFMYEHLPCYTLQSMLESHTWTQEDLVNIIRECGAAMWFAEQLGLLHLGWTLCHILIPVANMHRPMMCKVFGFGLMGVLVTDSHERLCWSPECLEKYQAMNGNPNWMTKVERSLLPMCDSWSLGTTVFALVSRRSPALTEAQAVSKKWQFTLAIDDVDPEAKSLIEGLLDPMADRRMSSEKAMRHEWIRRRWRPPPGVRKAFLKLEDFCVSPLPKRLFGRFLVRFLDSGHLLKIAKTFYSLDIGGTGCLNLKGLQIASRSAGRPTNAAENIWDHLGADGTAISLVRFAECLAEEVIDGRALRHAFESLDDNGSEQVSAPELFDALAALDDSLTMEEVVKHIERAELDIESDEEDENMQDHAIDYNEFVQLFPVRMARMGALKDRMLTSKSQWEDLTRSFESVSPEVDKWLRHIDTTLLTIRDLASKAVDNRNEYAGDAARGLKLQFAKIDEGLKCPPGPITQPEMQAKIKLGKKGLAQFYGFDTFMQDQALVENWHNLVSAEIKNLKAALAVNSKISGGVDSSKAHDAADSLSMKVKDLLGRVRGQLEEYASFADVLASPEALIGTCSLSGRGLRPRNGEEEDDAGDLGDDGGDDPGLGKLLEGMISLVSKTLGLS